MSKISHTLTVNCYKMPVPTLSSPDSDSLVFRTDYKPPTPPSNSGFHRYQFMLFEQPPDVSVSLTEQEEASRGNNSTHQLLQSATLFSHCSIIYHIPTVAGCQHLSVESAMKVYSKELKPNSSSHIIGFCGFWESIFGTDNKKPRHFTIFISFRGSTP